MYRILLSLATLLPLTTAICECGFSTNETHNTVFTDYLEQDFTNGKVDGWIPQEYNVSQQDARGPYGKQAHPENVVPTSQGLELWVRPSHIENKTIPMAEVASKRTDMLFGSFRIRARMSGVNGTCGAFFWFWNNTQEIDMEFLSRQFSQSNTAPVNLVIQSPASELAGFDASKTPGFDNHLLPFRPDLDFHEYRFDWIPGKVSFYADNVWLKDMTVDIPDTAGHVVLNHWSNGDKYWSGGPPEQDASMLVTHAAMYFNSSDKNMLALHKKQCKKRDSSKICVIPTDVRKALMLEYGGTSTPPDGGGKNGTTTQTTESAKKAAKTGSFGFIITGAVVGLFIVLFIAAMVTVRHWNSWRNKVSRGLGFKKFDERKTLGGSNSSSQNSSPLEMHQRGKGLV